MQSFRDTFDTRLDGLEKIQQDMLASWDQVATENAKVKKEFAQSAMLIEAGLKRMSKDKRDYTERNAATQ